MRSWVILFLLCVVMLPARLAQAEPAFDFKAVLKALQAATTVPPEWDGIWGTVDSLYDCSGVLQDVYADKDTLCGGKDIPAPGGPSFTCTGTADATTVHLTCTGGFDLFPDCHVDNVATLDGIRTATTYYYSITNNTTISGTGLGCPVGTQCSILHVHGTKLSSSPPAYCATPTLPATWGNVKAHYR